ncbi:nif-domain-containing protein [Phaffia rhodozyma]|uniref:Nif-domain-containing protein n=1 Tax=Phaffia rhodozyma TaxID=264483 RepID=A0A0F7SVZ8_PHARH|nr:nif-domain-containing protein [Phaffia rhodozyma]
MNSLASIDRFLSRTFRPPPVLPHHPPSSPLAARSRSASISVGSTASPSSSPVPSSSPLLSSETDLWARRSSSIRRRPTLASPSGSSLSSSASSVSPQQTLARDESNSRKKRAVRPRRWGFFRIVLKLWSWVLGLLIWCRIIGSSQSTPLRRREKGKGKSSGMSENSLGVPPLSVENPADLSLSFIDPRTQAIDPNTLSTSTSHSSTLTTPSLPTPSTPSKQTPASSTHSSASISITESSPVSDDLSSNSKLDRPQKSRLLMNPYGGSSLLTASSISNSSLASGLGQQSSLLLAPPSSVVSTLSSSTTIEIGSGAGINTFDITPPPVRIKKTPFHKPKTLILDLDETLIHSTSRPIVSTSGKWGGGRGRGEGHMVEVFLGGRSTVYHVYKRPYVDYFLKKVSSWYTLVIFTASMQEYADPVIDWLDGGRNMFAKRLYRESCVQHQNGAYVKDLACLEEDLGGVALIDNSPVSYAFHQSNGIPIDGWFSDPNDQALLDLLPVLDSLRFTSDVRHVLGLRGFLSGGGSGGGILTN